MSTYKLILSEIEESCGVTLEAVAELLPKVLVRDNKVYLPSGGSPALDGATARCALAEQVRFVGISKHTGYTIYEREI
ncbi:hypothetical protein SEA_MINECRAFTSTEVE_100 [Gordonia phage MinecraftSteve]|uniref:Uncharacterized protein n=1 Tax=Gordonia phage Waits TaxID=2108120 RepID=A0A2P1JSJ7_9CAUD|nr:hypothetical protein BEN61_gp011 [Gordonia phage Rosalind]YP_009624614.1 hypothetical protein FDJ48_gp011 [Gordonia phage Waits]QFP95164.1 hypothetical protein SEA_MINECRAFTSTEVE_100 [Gordonia phage MinecraftSteve]QWS67881.1 hypothetical protein SEA_DEKHOCKEY33_102 [Gordonia phage DekHockey33]WIC40192.1 hypothetical protein SEA_BATTLESHIP_102 [Gordonia phage Battleship]ANA87133.1 hypothetical protein PBI_ROSALIND_100 [Gordonia phage Rosalind]AVO22126.1 hypothetical protein PBI_WAITS_99 [Go